MGRLVGLRRGAEEAEDGGAGAGHAREDAAAGAAQPGDEIPDRRDHGDGGGLEVVAGFVEPEAELGRAGQGIAKLGQTRIVAVLEPAKNIRRDYGDQWVDQDDVTGGKMPERP